MFSDILLTVDYDHTLTATDSSIPARNLEAIRYFIDNGGAFTVNTGRSLPMIRSFRDIVPVNAPLLLYNGSASYDLEQEMVFSCHELPLSQPQVVSEVMGLFPDLTVEVQGLEAHYIFEENPDWDAFSDNNLCTRAHVQPADDLGPFLKFTLYGDLSGHTVASLFESTPEEKQYMDAVEQQLRQRYGDTCEVFRASAKIIDVHAKGVSKIRAARQLQQQLGRKILVCVGDGENDLPMLQGADYAYSPADGVVADRFENVCPCDLGSVADVIYKKIPEILEKNLDNRT